MRTFREAVEGAVVPLLLAPALLFDPDERSWAQAWRQMLLQNSSTPRVVPVLLPASSGAGVALLKEKGSTGSSGPRRYDEALVVKLLKRTVAVRVARPHAFKLTSLALL